MLTRLNGGVCFLHSKTVKRIIGEASVCVVISAILLTILIPTISKCLENGDEKKCRRNLDQISSALDKAINNESDSKKWIELLSKNNSAQTINALKLTMPAAKANKIDVSDYYIKSSNGEFQIRCLEHPKIDDYSVKQPQNFKIAVQQSIKDELVDYIKVDGIRTYFQNDAINPNNPEQMKFTSEDNLKEIFSDLEVSVIHLGNKIKNVPKDAYTITTDGFNMSKIGEKTIIIEYVADKTWNSIEHATFTFNVIEKKSASPLTVDFGEKGIYDLAAWDWTDYIVEASQENGKAKNFDASIVFFDDKYYYYPDGFRIDTRNNNLSPLSAARDIDDTDLPAYNIEINPKNIINSKEDKDEMKKAKNGALMLEENLAYIWQTEPSKELNSGWIRIFCEMKKK